MFTLLRALPAISGYTAGYAGARGNIERLNLNSQEIKVATTQVVIKFAFLASCSYMLSNDNGYGVFNMATEMITAAGLGVCIGAIEAIPNQNVI